MANKKCEDNGHSKIFSGEYQATNPPMWAWICENCGETGKETAHHVAPKSLKKYARVMIHFHPDDSWWKKYVGKGPA